MTKRDFFILLIKVFGLYFILATLFSALPGNLSFALGSLDTISVILIVVTLVVVIGLFVFLIFKSDKVVTLLKLDKGFDDDKIELGNLQATDIIKVGTFIIGGLLLLDNIPSFLSHSFFAFQRTIIGMGYSSQEKFYWIVSGLNIVIGYLLMTNYGFVARMLNPKKKEKE